MPDEASIISMKDKVMIVGPAGGNGNYIALTILNLVNKNEFCYHMQGTHGDYKHRTAHIQKWEDEYEYYLEDETYINLQNIFEEKFWFVLINWWEKKFHSRVENDVEAISAGNEWIETQTKLWKHYSHPIVRAILKWFYGYLQKELPECKRISIIKDTFNFGAFYKDFDAVKKEFDKFGTSYTEEMYEQWKISQSKVFHSFDQIQNNPVKNLEHDYQKAIKIGFLGMENGLNENDCWEKYKELLQ